MWTITTTGGIFEGKYLSYIGYYAGGCPANGYTIHGETTVKRIETLTGAWKRIGEGSQLLLETPRQEGDLNGACKHILIFRSQIVAIEMTDDAEDDDEEEDE